MLANHHLAIIVEMAFAASQVAFAASQVTQESNAGKPPGTKRMAKSVLFPMYMYRRTQRARWTKKSQFFSCLGLAFEKLRLSSQKGTVKVTVILPR
jgi:hypothetical protein